MLLSDALKEIGEFTSGFKRVYRYKQEFIPDHFITVNKVSKVEQDGSFREEFEIIESESTTLINNFNKDLFLKFLQQETLIYYNNMKWFVKTVDLRTDSCDCGAWSTRNANCHSYWCKRSGSTSY